MKKLWLVSFTLIFSQPILAASPIEFPHRGPDGEFILNETASAVTFSPNERQLAVASIQGIFLYDLQQEIPAIVKWIPLDNEIPLLLQYSPEGQAILSFNRNIQENNGDYSLRLWDIDSGRIIQSFQIPPSRLVGYRGNVFKNNVLCMTFSPDRRKILTGNGDSTATLIDIASATTVFHLDAHSVKRTDIGYDSGTTAVAFSPDGKYWMTGGWDGVIKQWDSTTGTEMRQWNAHKGSIRNIRFTQDGSRFLSSCYRSNEDRAVHLWDWSSGQLITSASGHTNTVQDIQFLPGDRQFVSVATDGYLKVWETGTERELRSIPTNLPSPTYSDSPQGQYAFFSFQGNYLYTSSTYNHTRLWSISNWEAIESKSLDFRSLSRCAISPDNRYFLTTDNDTVLFWEMSRDQSNKEKPVISRQIRIPGSWVRSLSFSPDGQYLLTVSYPDGIVRIWDLSTSEVLQSIGRDDIKPYSGLDFAEFSPDGRLIVTDGGASIRVWDWKTKTQIQSFLVDGYAPAWGSISPDGKSILTGHANHTKIAVRLWDLEKGTLLRTHNPEQELLGPLQNPLNGQWGYAGFVEDYNDDTVTVAFWDGYTGKEQRLALKTPALSSLPTFSRDGRYAFAAPEEGIQMFDVRTGEKIRSFGKSYAIAYSSDGLWALTTGYGIARIWNLALSSSASNWQTLR